MSKQKATRIPKAPGVLVDAVLQYFYSLDQVQSRSGEVPARQTIIKVLSGHLTSRHIWEAGLLMRKKLGLPEPPQHLTVRHRSGRRYEIKPGQLFSVDSNGIDEIKSKHDSDTGANGNDKRSGVSMAGRGNLGGGSEGAHAA